MSLGRIQVLGGSIFVAHRIRLDEAGLSTKVKIYSADISTSDTAAMREADSACPANATNPAVVGRVSVRAFRHAARWRGSGATACSRRSD